MVAIYNPPVEYKQAPAWTADESTAFTSATDGHPCTSATVASIVWEPTGGTFTAVTLIFEGYKAQSGWTIMTADEVTYTDNARHDDKRIDVTEFIRFGWRATSSAGGTGADKFTGFA